jgi:7,8-dihydropterin-6-yl-methyl-4-(beta-D-ribofuranosyl)aminobenzene 5'-phosphate synthase
MEPIRLEPVDSLTVTTLVDNMTDLLLVDQGPAKRPPMTMAVDPSVPARFIEGGRTGDALRAEHGFSCLVTIEKAGRSVRVLFDAGLTPDGLVENMRRLDISAHDIDIVVLSHGHWDHTTGMHGLVQELGSTSLPVLIHPEFWSRRRVALPGRDPIELPSTSKSALEGAGFEIVEQRQPSFLLDGSLLVTGEVDAERAWSSSPAAATRGSSTSCALRAQAHRRGPHPRGDRRLPPQRAPVREDHRADGRRARGLLGRLPRPCHCTGWRAIHAIAAAYPDAFIQNSVGTRFEFAGSAD